jgi:hypothetical protein
MKASRDRLFLGPHWHVDCRLVAELPEDSVVGIRFITYAVSTAIACSPCSSRAGTPTRTSACGTRSRTPPTPEDDRWEVIEITAPAALLRDREQEDRERLLRDEEPAAHLRVHRRAGPHPARADGHRLDRLQRGQVRHPRPLARDLGAARASSSGTTWTSCATTPRSARTSPRST